MTKGKKPLKSFAAIVIASSLLAWAALRPQSAEAVEFRLAGGAVEEGDNRFRPTVGFEFVAPSGLLGAAMVYGRHFGPVTEQTVIFSGGQPLDLFGSTMVQGLFGVSIISERTAIKASDTSVTQTDQSTNVGGLFGIRGKIFTFKAFTIAGSWESHLYPPGFSAIFLATGRKQLLTLNAGMSL